MSDEALRALVGSNPGQASYEEYHLADAVLRARAPCNCLVFGAGRDSGHWVRVNQGGRTTFLENDRTWTKQVRDAEPGIDIYPVTYWTRRFLWPLLRYAPRALLVPRLTDSVLTTRWDVILVDAPRGTRWYRRGRMQSICSAAVLGAEAGADVLVHDCHRPVERACCDRYLGPTRLVARAGSMRHYRLA